MATTADFRNGMVIDLDGQLACVIPCGAGCGAGYSCEDVGGGTERCTEQGGENGQTIRHGKDTVVQCMKN